MKRVIIIGVTGSGKTTFGQKLAHQEGIPFYDLDDLHWLPNWQERSKEDFRKIVDETTQADSWVLVGNYSKQRDISWSRADTVIFLRVGFFRCFWQLFCRTIRYLLFHESHCNGNKDSFRKTFCSRNSLFVWFFRVYFDKTRSYTAIMNDKSAYPHLKKVMLTSRKQQDDFILSQE